jgi:RND family efflux transporter MFP subunit
MIIKKLVEEGEVVGAGTPIALLAEMDPILVKASIPDHLIRKVSVGDSAIIRADWAPDDSFSGRIIRMESMADPVTRTLNIEILVPNPSNILKPGLITRVEITSERKEAGIFLPINSVIGFGKSPYVFVVRSGHAQNQEVETGEIIQEEVEIVEGITPGDLIIISGQEYVRDGQSVSIKEKGELDI